ncbi:MAG: hypothetical protein WDW36_001900 [Sanguina aurantia]
MRVPLPLSPLGGSGGVDPSQLLHTTPAWAEISAPMTLTARYGCSELTNRATLAVWSGLWKPRMRQATGALAQHLQPRKSAPVETITRLTRARCVNTSAEGNNCSIRALAAGVLTLSDNLVASAAARHLAGNNFAAGRRQIAQLCSRPGSSGHGLSPENLRQFFGHLTGVLSGDVHVKDIVVLLLMGGHRQVATRG